MRLALLVCMTALMSGCVSVSNVKTMQIPASGAPVAVTSRAQAKCFDLLFILTCTLNLEMESSSGQKVSDFPVSKPKPSPRLKGRRGA